MRRISFIMMIAVALTLTWLVYARSQTSRSTQTPQAESRTAQQRQIAVQRTISTQQRLNSYFHSDVIPKLKNCWTRVQGKGTIEIEHTYTKEASGKWVSENVAVIKSTLPRRQDTVALQCMQDSVRATSFSSQVSDGNEQRYVVRWTWPVPFPANAAEQTAAMFRSNGGVGEGGGCDGHGAQPSCYTCDSTSSCIPVCVGYKSCLLGGGKNPTCTAFSSCASGGPFGVAGGGLIMY